MSVTNPTGNPASYPATVQRKSGDEPRTDFWTATFDPLLNRTAYLQDQLLGTTNGLRPNLASQALNLSGVRIVGVEAHTGANAQGNYAASALYDLLVSLWDNKAGLTTLNVFGAVQDLSKGFTVSNAASIGEVQVRKRFLRDRVPLSDANHTIDVTQGDRFTLSGSPAAPRTITLDSSVNVPEQGETLTVIIPELTTSAQPAYTIQRGGGTVIAEVNGNTSGDGFNVCVEFEYDDGAWRLGQNTGCFYDDNTFTTRAGVIPGAGA